MLTKLFRKRGTGEGQVAESNPQVAAKETAKEESKKAQEVSKPDMVEVLNPLNHFSETLYPLGSPARIRHNTAISDAIDLHNKEKFAEAHDTLQGAWNMLKMDARSKPEGFFDKKASITSTGRGPTHGDMFAQGEERVKRYRQAAVAWHAAQPPKRSLLDDE